MQSASAALIAAILAKERQPVHEVSIDWAANGHGAAGTLDDQTPRVESVETVRELSTNLPAQAKVVAGRSAASATIVFGAGQVDALGRPDDERRKAAWYYSDDNAGSPLTGLLREHRPTRIKFGFRGDNGPETLTQFTGWTRDAEVDGRASTATFTADDAEDARAYHDLPMVLADDLTESGGIKPNLNNSFLVDWIFRRMGYYVSPPARGAPGPAGTQAWTQTFHGSCWPEVGTLATCYSLTFEPPNFFTKGFLQAIYFSGSSVSRCHGQMARNLRMDSTRSIGIEFWHNPDALGGVARGLVMLTGTSTGLSLFINTSGNLAIYIDSPGSAAVVHNSTLAVSASADHYIGGYITFGVNSYSGALRVDGSAQAFSSGAWTNGTSTPLTDVNVARAFVDTGGTILPAKGFFWDLQISEVDISASWNNAWASQNASIQPSLNKLLATPPGQGADAWGALEQLAESEFATVGKDETGFPSYRVRTSWAAPPYTVVQRTLTTADSIKGMVTARSVDSIRNRIIVKAQVPQVGGAGWVWESKAVIRVPANNEDIGYGNGVRVFSCGFESPVYNLDTSFAYFGAVVVPTESGYRASKFRDGSGGAISNLVITTGQVFSDYVNVSVSNPSNAFEIWLVNASGLGGGIIAGYPCLILYGRKVTFDQGDVTTGANVLQDISDATSIASFGEQKLELSDNPFRQDLDSVDDLGVELLANLKDPTRIVRGVEIVGDPRLQLGDRCNFEDPDGLVLDRDFWLTRIVSSFSRTDGFKQVVDVVEAV